MFNILVDCGTWHWFDVLKIVIREVVDRFGSPTEPGMLEGADKGTTCLEGEDKVAFPGQLLPRHVFPLEHKRQEIFFSSLLGFGRK